MIGGTNTLVLLLSSLTIVLAVHYARLARRRRIVIFLGLTALLGVCFLCLKGLEYYLDYRGESDPRLAVRRGRVGIARRAPPDQVPHVKLFLFLYWVMTGFHALHVTIGICAVLVILVPGLERPLSRGLLCARGRHGPLLALRGYRLDFPAADALPARHPPYRLMFVESLQPDILKPGLMREI